jgi:hypothetical protein
MPLATIRPAGEAGLYHIHFLDGGGAHPDHGLPGGGPVDPGFGRPGGGGGLHPGNRPPGSGNPAFPDNTLPSGPPPHVPAGTTLILVRDPAGIWHYAAIQPGQPVPPPLPGQGLPGGPPPTAGQPLPPTPAPKA